MPWIDPIDAYASEPRLPRRAPRTTAWDGEFDDHHRGVLLDTVSIDTANIDAGPHGFIEFLDCELMGTSIETADRSMVSMVDSRCHDADFSRARLGTLRGCEFVGCKLAGTDLSESLVRDCRFERCTFQYTNLRMATLERVAFVNCRFDDADFSNATADDLSFDGSELADVTIDRARLTRIDLRHATSLEFSAITSLAGCLLSDAQVQQLAYALALATGAAIERDPTEGSEPF